MAVQKASGEANLRANPSVKSGKQTESPSGAGKDMGGVDKTRGDHKVMSSDRPMPVTYEKDVRPSGVQHFSGEGV
jgi:hypothetical protein